MIDIVYSTVDNVRAALKLAWKHKIIWIFALLAAGGGMNFNSNGLNGLSEFGEQQEEYNLEMDTQASVQQMSFTFSPGNDDIAEISDVLGAETQNDEEKLLQGLGEINLVVPGILVGLSFLIFFLYMIVLGLMLKGWAKSSLVAGTIRGIDENELKLTSLGKIGRANMWRFVNFDILMALVVFGLVIAMGLLSAILVFGATTFQQLRVIFYILMFLVVFIGTLSMVSLGISTIFAYRHLISNEISLITALKMGLKTLRNSAWNFFKLALLNAALIIAGFIAFGAVLGIIFALIFFLFTLGDSSGPSTALLLIIGILSGPFLIASAIVVQGIWAYIRTYLEFTYSILYLHTQDIADVKNIKLIGEPHGA